MKGSMKGVAEIYDLMLSVSAYGYSDSVARGKNRLSGIVIEVSPGKH
jgi:hypothetical protein